MNDQNKSFSKRNGLVEADAPITIRHEAPDWLRDFVIAETGAVDLSINEQRKIICRMLYESPDPNNWSAGNVESEVRSLLEQAEWFYTYEYIENICANLEQYGDGRYDRFSERINEAFRRKGIGWKLTGGQVEVRGDESFEASVKNASEFAESTGRVTASQELHQALANLSKRPEADVTGAIQHAGAALECVARDVTGNSRATLGEIIKKSPNSFPPPLDEVVGKIWGYCSENGRHLREGSSPHFDEAELIVGLSGTISTYLMRKSP
tara:strand:+ start:1184 stop:1984 length:801 start_codon:yes stop_codon:yes gene_type:complete